MSRLSYIRRFLTIANVNVGHWSSFKIVYEKFNIILLFYYNIEFIKENESIARETYFQITFGIHFILMIIIIKSINNVNKLL